MKNDGFTLLELMIVVAIISIIAAASVPNLLSSRIAAHESSAIAALRNISSAQAQFWSVGAMDDDLDGQGEFGWFGELAGVSPMNGRAGGNGQPGPLNPPILGQKMATVDANGNASQSGYFFRMFLPDAAGAGVSENPGGGSPGTEGANSCEIYWSAYAYPITAHSGMHTFFVDHRGDIVQTQMEVTPYDASAGIPAWNAALVAASVDMGDSVGVGGLPAFDGNTWTPVQ